MTRKKSKCDECDKLTNNCHLHYFSDRLLCYWCLRKHQTIIKAPRSEQVAITGQVPNGTKSKMIVKMLTRYGEINFSKYIRDLILEDLNERDKEVIRIPEKNASGFGV